MKFATSAWLDVNQTPGDGRALNSLSFGYFAPGELQPGFIRYRIAFEIPDPKKPDDFVQPTMGIVK